MRLVEPVGQEESVGQEEQEGLEKTEVLEEPVGLEELERAYKKMSFFDAIFYENGQFFSVASIAYLAACHRNLHQKGKSFKTVALL